MRYQGCLLGLAVGDALGTTHGARDAIDACRYFTALIVGAINGQDKETLLSDHYTPLA